MARVAQQRSLRMDLTGLEPRKLPKCCFNLPWNAALHWAETWGRRPSLCDSTPEFSPADPLGRQASDLLVCHSEADRPGQLVAGLRPSDDPNFDFPALAARRVVRPCGWKELAGKCVQDVGIDHV